MTAAGAPRFDATADRTARAQAGCPDAFAAIFEDYRVAIFNYLYRMCLDPNDAEDFTADTFVKAWQHIGKTQPGLKVGPWLYRIAMNVFRDEYRHRRVVRFVPLHGQEAQGHDNPGTAGAGLGAEIVRAVTTEPAHEPEGLALGGEVAAEVRAILDRLPPRPRAALILREYHDLDYHAIGARLGANRPAVKSLLTRARAAFLRLYQEAHPEARLARPVTGPKGGRPRTDGAPGGSGVARKSGRGAKPWMAQPYDPRDRRCHYLGFFTTREAAQAVVDAWRAQQQGAA